MADLFGNTEMPRWLTSWYENRRAQTHESGMQAGRTFAQSYLAKEQRDQQQSQFDDRLAEEQRQFDSRLPLLQKESELRAEESRNAIAKRLLEVQQFNEGQRVKNAQIAGMVDLGKVLSEISTTGSWDKPEGRAKFWSTVASHPSLALMPNFRLLEDQFDIADRAAAKAEEARIRTESNEKIASEKAQMTLLLQDLKNHGLEVVQDAKGKWGVRRAEIQNQGKLDVEAERGKNRLDVESARGENRISAIEAQGEQTRRTAAEKETLKSDGLTRQYQSVLRELRNLKSQGVDSASVGSDMVVRRPSFFRNDTPIDELIQSFEQKINAAGGGKEDESQSKEPAAPAAQPSNAPTNATPARPVIKSMMFDPRTNELR